MFTAEAIQRIKDQNMDDPLFLYLAYQAVHTANTIDPLQAPLDWVKRYKHIQHEQRREYAAVVGYMDYGIGRVRTKIKKCFQSS